MLPERLAFSRTSPVSSSATDTPSALASGSTSEISGKPRDVSHFETVRWLMVSDCLGKVLVGGVVDDLEVRAVGVLVRIRYELRFGLYRCLPRSL